MRIHGFGATMQLMYRHENDLQPWRWRKRGLRNVCIQPPNYTAKQPQPELLRKDVVQFYKDIG